MFTVLLNDSSELISFQLRTSAQYKTAKQAELNSLPFICFRNLAIRLSNLVETGCPLYEVFSKVDREIIELSRLFGGRPVGPDKSAGMFEICDITAID